MKDLIIGSSDSLDYNRIHNWITSIDSVGFDGDIVLILYRHDQQLLNSFKDSRVQLVCPTNDWRLQELSYDQRQSDNHVCQRRFFHVWQYLKETDVKYRYVIHNDVTDVIYQRNPSNWLTVNATNSLVAPSEGMMYDNQAWGKNDFQNAFGPYFYEYYAKNETIVNAGTFAGSHEFIEHLCMCIFLLANKKSNEAADQAALNLLVNSIFKNDVVYGTLENGWSCQCEVMMDPSNKGYILNEHPPTIDAHGFVKNKNDELVVLVHQYNRVPHLLQKINSRYI